MRANAEKERRKRTSPQRYQKVKSKITSQMNTEFAISPSAVPVTASQHTRNDKFFSDGQGSHERSVNRTQKSPLRPQSPTYKVTNHQLIYKSFSGLDANQSARGSRTPNQKTHKLVKNAKTEVTVQAPSQTAD